LFIRNKRRTSDTLNFGELGADGVVAWAAFPNDNFIAAFADKLPGAKNKKVGDVAENI
jgi:hypothetical protein